MSTNAQTTNPTETEKQEKKLRFDDASLNHYASLYIDPRAHEPTVWLGRYVRNKCNESLKVLVAKVQELQNGKGSYEAFHKILTGKAFNTKDGREAAGSVDNLIVLVDQLKKKDRLEEFAGKVPFVQTKTFELINNYIAAKRAPDRVCKFGVIIGHTGAQKSASYQHICLLANNVLSEDQKDLSTLGESKVKLCVHFEAPYRPSMPEFIKSFALQYGVKRQQASRKGVSAIIEQVNENSLIIIDNFQRLFKPPEEENKNVAESLRQPIWNFIQALQDDKKCTIILSITPDFLATLYKMMTTGYFEQFEGRAGGRDQFLILPDYADLKGDILPIAKAFGMLHAESHGAHLEEIARKPGRIRILFNQLQNGRQLANLDPSKSELTIEVLKAANPAKTKKAENI